MNDHPAAADTTARGESTASTQRASYWLACALVYVAIVVLYAPSVHYAPLALDDQTQLREVAALPLSGLFSWDHFGHFRPLKNLLFWLLARSDELALWRTGFVLLFVLGALLVQRFSTRVAGSPWFGLSVVACWALNPSAASAVCWLSAVNGVYALCAMLSYLLLSERSTASLLSPPQRRSYRALATIVLASGIMAHELALLSPLLLYFLQGLWPRMRDRRLYTSAIAVVMVYAVAAVLAGGAASPAYRFATDTPRWLMTFSAARYAADNALLWLWPSGRFGVLLADRPQDHLVASSVWWLLLFAAGQQLWRLRKRDPLLTFALAWSALSLALVCNLLPVGNTPVAVHYGFVPGVGFALALSRVFVLLAARVVTVRSLRERLLAVAIVAVAGSYGWQTSHVVAAWENEEALYTATLDNYPDNMEALINLAAYYMSVERESDAEPLLERARASRPDDLNVVRNTYTLLVRRGDLAGALASLRQHPALLAESEFALREGEVLAQLERSAEARSAFQRAFAGADPVSSPAEWCAAGYGLSIAQLQTGLTPREVLALVERLMVHCHDPQLTQLRDLLR